MFLASLLTIVLLGSGIPAVDPAPSSLPDKELDAAARELQRAAVAGSEAEKREALAKLVALDSAAVVTVLQGEYARASGELRGMRDDAVRAKYTLERKEELLAVMELRAERDDSLEGSLRGLREGIAELRAELERTQGKSRRLATWCDDLGKATSDLFERLGAGARRQAIGGIWDDAAKHPELGVRLGAVEMLGRIAEKGAALQLFKLLGQAQSDRVKIRNKIPKLEKEVREFERRLQEEAERTGGGSASMPQYERLKMEAAAARREATRLAHLLDALSEATARALVHEEGKDLDKALTTMLRAQKKAKDGLGLHTLDVFRHARNPAVSQALATLLGEEGDPLQRAAIIDALAYHGDRSVEQVLIDVHLRDESWHVRSRAAAALATLRSRVAIPALIERLEVDEGRLRTDLAAALTSLTAKPFGTNAPAWRRWWQAEGEGFEVPAEEVETEGSLDAEESLGVTFFGIKTESQRVLFIFDVSGSMTFSMVPRNNPNDDRNKPYDMPRPGEDSRLDVAKRELIKAFGGIRDGGLFNIILYASDVWSWEDELVEMETDSRSDALRFAESLSAVGGTNIYGALARAFELAEVKDGDEWNEPLVDTFFILSDGRASVGVTTDSDEILTFVRERNRGAGIVIHTIGLSGAQDAYLLRSLAEQNGGAYAAR